MSEEKKPTKAQREWCRRIATPQLYQLVETGRMFYNVRTRVSAPKPTWPLVAGLEDAGLITWREDPDPLFAGRMIKIAELTPAGWAASGVKPTP